MTRTHTLALTVALALATTCSAVAAGAQQGPPPPMRGHGGPPPDRRDGPSIDERVQRMTSELTLSADQATKVKAMLTAERHVADSLHGARALRMDADRTAMETRRANMEKGLVALLTPEQRATHEALMRQRRDGSGGHPPRGGRPGDGRDDRRGPHGGDHRRR